MKLLITVIATEEEIRDIKDHLEVTLPYMIEDGAWYYDEA